MVKAFKENKIEDAWLVPVGLSYERLVEGGYDREILGRPKVPESFFSTVWSGLKHLFNWRRCNMRIDFGEPVSLKAFKDMFDQFAKTSDQEATIMKEIREDAKEWTRYVKETNGGNARIMQRTYTGPAFGLDYVDEHERFFVSALARHMVYGKFHIPDPNDNNWSFSWL